LQDIVLWVFPTGGLFLWQSRQAFKNKHAKQSVVRFHIVKSYRIKRVAFYPPVCSLRRNCAHWLVCKYRVHINYQRILLLSCRLHTVNVTFGQGQYLHPTTFKGTTKIAIAHQHRNRECHTRCAWEGLAGMGVSPVHLLCHTWGTHGMHLRSLWNCKHSSFKW
jgi:hypothetical protein